MVNLQTFLKDFVKSVNHESFPLILAAAIYKHFTNILKWTELKKGWRMVKSETRRDAETVV